MWLVALCLAVLCLQKTSLIQLCSCACSLAGLYFVQGTIWQVCVTLAVQCITDTMWSSLEIVVVSCFLFSILIYSVLFKNVLLKLILRLLQVSTPLPPSPHPMQVEPENWKKSGKLCRRARLLKESISSVFPGVVEWIDRKQRMSFLCLEGGDTKSCDSVGHKYMI